MISGFLAIPHPLTQLPGLPSSEATWNPSPSGPEQECWLSSPSRKEGPKNHLRKLAPAGTDSYGSGPQIASETREQAAVAFPPHLPLPLDFVDERACPALPQESGKQDPGFWTPSEHSCPPPGPIYHADPRMPRLATGSRGRDGLMHLLTCA